MMSHRDQIRLRPIENQSSWENTNSDQQQQHSMETSHSPPCTFALTLPVSLRASGPVINVTELYERQTKNIDSVDRLLEDLESFQKHLASETFKNTSLYSKLELGYKKAIEQGQKVHDLAYAEIESISRSKRLIQMYLSDSDNVSDLESSKKVEMLSQKCEKLQSWLELARSVEKY